MAKSISGVTKRKGTTVTIGDNRYGLREAYDSEAKKKTEKYYRDGDTLTIKEVKNTLANKVTTIKP